MEEFIERKNFEITMKSGKKDKEVALKLLAFLRKSNLEITDLFRYFT